MTPLAQRIFKDFLRPVRERVFVDQCGLWARLRGAKQFDVSAVEEGVFELARGLESGGLEAVVATLDHPRAFLPTFGTDDATWIEMRTALGPRLGVLLVQDGEDWVGRVSLDLQTCEQILRFRRSDGVALISPPVSAKLAGRGPLVGPEPPQLLFVGLLALAAVLLINSPQTFGARVHSPHAGLARRLMAARGLVGSFPLHAWTEIVRRTDAARDLSTAAERVAGHSGRKPWHFVPAFRRVRLGRSELVKAHHRGDPALGIRQSRWRVT